MLGLLGALAFLVLTLGWAVLVLPAVFMLVTGRRPNGGLLFPVIHFGEDDEVLRHL